MKLRILWSLVAVGSLLTAGCTAPGDDDDGSSPTPTPGGTFEFESGGYTVAPGTEEYHCFIVQAETGATASEKVGATRFAYTPDSNALHHIVIFSDPNDEPEGDRPCQVFEGQWEVRYAGGTVTDPLVTPAGVAVPVRPVETFVIQFHYLNASDAPVVDNTRVEIDFTTPGEDFIPSGLIVAGKTNFTIPPSTPDHEEVGVCEAPAGTPDLTVFAVWPHMHQLGYHFKIEHEQAGNVDVLMDTPWNFGDQPMWRPESPLIIGSGDVVTTTCTYNNPSTDPVEFGESSNQEMCFDFFFYYPRPSVAPAMIPCL